MNRIVLLLGLLLVFEVNAQDATRIENAIQRHIENSFKGKKYTSIKFYDITVLKTPREGKLDSLGSLFNAAVLEENYLRMLIYEQQIDSLKKVITNESKSYGVKHVFYVQDDSIFNVWNIAFKLNSEYKVERTQLIYSAKVREDLVPFVRSFEFGNLLFNGADKVQNDDIYGFFRTRLMSLPSQLRQEFYVHTLMVLRDCQSVESFNPTMLIYKAAIRACEKSGIQDKEFEEPAAFYDGETFMFYQIEVVKQSGEVVTFRFDPYFVLIDG